MTVDGSAPPRVGHRYHVRDDHPYEVVTFTAGCLEVREHVNGLIYSRWDNGVILSVAGVLYYPNDPQPVAAGVAASLEGLD